MSNPNNCEMCGHKARPEGGHCYMFRDEPDDVCLIHTERRGIGSASYNELIRQIVDLHKQQDNLK